MLRIAVVILIVALASGCAFNWITPEPVSLPTVTPNPPPVTIDPNVLPEEVGESLPDPTPLPSCIIVKGNISRDGRKLYHLPGMSNYNQIKIDESVGEMFFCSEQEATDAGWTKAGN